MGSRFLAGTRVVELSEVWAGPMAGSLLGDLGADVVKVESYPRSSITRRAPATGGPGDGPGYERNAIHHLVNRNKRNIALNLRTDEGAEVLRRLLAEADVFFESYSAGTIDEMGFGWETVHALNPRLVMVSMPGWGVEGPYRGYVTLGSGLDAAAGHAAVRGSPRRPPEETQAIFHSDAIGALALVFGAVTGLVRREATGEGSYTDISQVEVLSNHLPGIVAEWEMNGRLPERLGNRDPYVVPHGCYRAAGGEAGEDDAWVVIAAETDAHWRGLAEAAGHPEWAAEEHPWASVPGRLRARAEIDAALAEYAQTGTAEEIAAAVQRCGAIAAPVIAPWSLLSQPQLTSRGWLRYVEHAKVGLQAFPGFLWDVSPDAPSWDRPAGLVGEHNHEVLGELGYTSDAVAQLAAAGVIGDSYGA